MQFKLPDIVLLLLVLSFLLRFDILRSQGKRDFSGQFVSLPPRMYDQPWKVVVLSDISGELNP